MENYLSIFVKKLVPEFTTDKIYNINNIFTYINRIIKTKDLFTLEEIKKHNFNIERIEYYDKEYQSNRYKDIYWYTDYNFNIIPLLEYNTDSIEEIIEKFKKLYFYDENDIKFIKKLLYNKNNYLQPIYCENINCFILFYFESNENIFNILDYIFTNPKKYKLHCTMIFVTQNKI
jgi:hypothetical protein